MSLRDDLLPVFDEVRGIVDDLGLRRYSVALVTRTWPGVVGRGTPTSVTLTLTPTPRVRTLSEREIASSGGTYRKGDLRIDKITPAYAIAGSVAFTGAPGDGTVTPSMAMTPAGVAPATHAFIVQIQAGATFIYSTDGGVTWSAPLSIAATVALPTYGISLAFAGSFTTGSQYSFSLVTGGYTPQQLQPTPSNAQDVFFNLSGDEGDDMLCTVAGPVDYSRAFGYSLIVHPRRESPSA